MPRLPAVEVGDKVSVAVREFGEEYARERGGEEWESDNIRDEGRVLKKRSGKFFLDFDDDEPKRWWQRKSLRVVEKSTPPRREVVMEEGDSSEVDSIYGEEMAALLEQADESSSSDSSEDAAGEADWLRDDEQFQDERVRQGFTTRQEPIWHTCPKSCDSSEDIQAYFFDVCLSWLNTGFFAELADIMQQNGRDRGAAWASWRVNVNDIWQWLGVWFYMLAFPVAGERRAYFNPAPGKPHCFGPRHALEETLQRGKNGGGKGCKWFENMQACFELPTGPNARESDPFMATRYMWDTCRATFNAAVSPGWIMTLDESMVKWLGKSMPGLMVVPRKPTPMGLEVHTLCCSLSGVLVNFEVFEGKEAMESREFVNQKTDAGVINKSTALTLRCLKSYFSSVCHCK